MLLALTLISFFTYMYFTVFFWNIFAEVTIPSIIFTSCGLFILFNIFFNYIMTIRTDPGDPKKEFPAYSEIHDAKF